mgnify:CR=1 FL=1
MRFRSIPPVLIAALAAWLFASDATAMYHPTLGRFVQRDTAGTILGCVREVIQQPVACIVE